MKFRQVLTYVGEDELGQPSSSSRAPAEFVGIETAASTVWIGRHVIRYYNATYAKAARFRATCGDDTHMVWDAAKWRWYQEDAD